jgi:hypothetical protein
VEDFFSYGFSGIRKFFREHLVAILYTLIFHLVVLIVLVLVKVDRMKQGQELGVLIEFEDKSIDEILADEETEVPAEWLEQVMRLRELSSNRAVNVNAGDEFSEQISTGEFVQHLLDEIEKARNEQDRERLEELQAILAAADYVPPQQDQDTDNGEYTGPTTITYEFLEPPTRRGKVFLTVPVYRCEGSGLVRVEIRVSREGNVVDARIQEPIEGTDRECFARAAVAAALSSRFRVDPNAPEAQRALITYTFIAQ